MSFLKYRIEVLLLQEFEIPSDANHFCFSDQDWRRESSNGNLALTDSMISQFIIMNMLHKDITVEEASSNQFIDIQQSEMMQLARPLSNKKDGFKFSALVKDTNKSVMINDQTIFSIDMHDLSMMNILVVHDEGKSHDF